MKRALALVLTASIILTGAPAVLGEDLTLMPEVRVPELVAVPMSTEGTKELAAHPKGPEITKNAKFSDIAGSADKTSILRMAAEGVISGAGGKYRPADAITRQEALAYLVRMRGNEAAVQQRLSVGSGTSQASYVSNLFREYANEALTLGIMTAAEDGSLDAPATREQIALWVGRAVNLTAVYGNPNVLNSLADAAQVAPENRGLIEALLAERLFEPDSGNRFNPARQVTRGEMARIMAKSSDRLYTVRNMASSFGVVSGIVSTPRYEGGATITENTYTIKGIDGTPTTVKTAYNSKTKQLTDFAVLKNGSVSAGGLLAVGDQVELLTQNDQLILAQVYTDGTILNKLKADAVKDQALRTYYGTVSARIQENRQLEGRLYKTDRIRVKNHTGQTFDIVVNTDTQTGVKQDVIVQRAGTMGGVDLLQVGDGIEYAVKDPNLLLYVNANPSTQTQVKGTVRLVEAAGETTPAYLTVLDYSNVIYRYPVAGYADITINGEYGKLSDLRFGQNISLSMNNGLVIKVQAETFTSPGYIAPESKMRIGTVKAVSGNAVTVQIDDGSSLSLTLGDATVIRKNNGIVSKSILQPGDRVKLYFSEVDSSIPTRVEIEGKEQLIKGVYKGKIQQVNGTTNQLVLRDPQILRNDQWVATGAYTMTIEMEPKGQVYYNGSVVKFSTIKPSFINSEVYVAVKDSYGRDMAVQGIIKSGSERIHNDKIYAVNQAIQKFELGNKINYSFTPGTLVVRENRLVDTDSITSKDSALVVSSYNQGQHNAGVVSLITGGESFLSNIYLGTIYKVYSGQFSVMKFTHLDNSVFTTLDLSKEVTFGYGSDTYMFDVTGETPTVITPYKFFNGGYSKAENKDANSKGLDYEYWYTFIVADENNEAYAMMLRKKAILKGSDIDDTYSADVDQHKEMQKLINQLTLSRGTVSSIDTTWNRLRLQNSSDYSSGQKQWVTNRADMYIEVADSIILKNNEPISFSDIQAGDRVNAVRIKENVMVLIVED